MKRNVEPDLGALLPQLWRKHIQLVTTKTDFKTRSITHHPIYAHTAINVSDKGIPEPVIEETANLDSIDIIFVPLLAFDRQGHRIGYGGGFYDQVLSDLPSRTLKIGLSLSGGLDAFNFVEEHDVPLDWVLTPFESIEIK